MEEASIIVTAANDLYFSLASDLIQSLLRFKNTHGRVFDIGILDVGLTDGQREELSAGGFLVKKAGIDIEYRGREAWEKEMPFIRAMTARPFLPNYFPEYKTYMWLDADTWLQTAEILDEVLPRAAKDDAIYIAAEFDRDYRQLFANAALWQVHFDWYKAIFPPTTANNMSLRPMLNSGVFAMSNHSPVWNLWRETYSSILQNIPTISPNYFMADQLSLNVAVYLNKLPMHILPTEYNWNSLLRLPSFDKKKKMYVRPSLPHTVLSVLHLAGDTKAKRHKIPTTDNNEMESLLTYAAYKALAS